VINLDNEINKISSSFNLGVEKSPFKNSGFYFNNCAYTVNLDAKQPKVLKNLKDVLEEDHLVPREYWVEKSKLKEWKFMKGAKSIQRVHKQTGTIYKYEEGKMSFPDDINKPSRTILTGEGGSTPSRFKHIIKTNKGYRRLLPVELERLNGFPDNWTKFGSNNEIISDTKRAFFMGNALVVGLVEKVGKAIADDLEIKC
jgi:DNA (cytosine-5)-methyltransferase 1